jgi:hypothetical protein
MRNVEADRLAKWAKAESRKLVRDGEKPGSRMETEAIQNWKSLRPDLHRAMQERGALRALAHVLVDRMASQVEAYLKEGYPMDDARVTAYSDWMMMEEATPAPRRLPDPTTA